MSKRNAAFTIVDLTIVVICTVLIGALIFGVLSPVFTRKKSRHIYSTNALRIMHTGLVLFAQGNDGHYTGVMSDGKTIDPSAGLSPQGRAQKLINDNYFTAEFIQDPSDPRTATTSYAMLKIDYNADGTIADTARNKEWRDTSNTLAPVLSDRAVVSPSRIGYVSIHSKSEWQGSIGWNDNHVTFEKTSIHSTKYDTTTHAADDLFTTDSTNAGDNAFMVWTDTDSL